MNRHDRALRRLVYEFLDEGRPFDDFHEGFIACWTRLPARALAPAARSRWNDIYGLVLIALPDPVGDGDTARGAIRDPERRTTFRWAAAPSR